MMLQSQVTQAILTLAPVHEAMWIFCLMMSLPVFQHFDSQVEYGGIMSHIWGILLACRLVVCLLLCPMGANMNAVPVSVATVEEKFDCCIVCMMTPHKE